MTYSENSGVPRQVSVQISESSRPRPGLSEWPVIDIRPINFLYRYVPGLGVRDVVWTMSRAPLQQWTAEEVARIVRRPVRVVEEYLQTLVCEGLLDVDVLEGIKVYRLIPEVWRSSEMRQWLAVVDRHDADVSLAVWTEPMAEKVHV